MDNFDNWLQTEPDYGRLTNNDSDNGVGDVEAVDELKGW